MNINNFQEGLDCLMYCGLKLSPEQKILIENSLIVLQNENRFNGMYFWGRINGILKDYYIAFGYKRDCLRERKYFFSVDGYQWFILPFVQDPKIFQATMLCLEPFNGVPSLVVAVKLDPIFDKDNNGIISISLPEKILLKEEERLSAIVFIISEESVICPRGSLYKLTDGCVVPNQMFNGLNDLQCEDFSNYQIYRLPRNDLKQNFYNRSDYNYPIDFMDCCDMIIPKGQAFSLTVQRNGRLVIIKSLIWLGGQNHTQKSLSNSVECLEDLRFYRDPNRPIHKIWTSSECSKYYLCLENEVFNFKCSEGLLFDVVRQICDFKQNVDNCDITAETPVPKPLLENAECEEEYHWGCADGTCLPNEYFCDGSVDCPDESDEGWCDAQNDPNAASTCNTQLCKLPDCFCSKDGTQIPGNLEPQSVPQMILLSFDDAINFENWELFSQHLLKGNRRNPNGCPIKATFFVSHPFTNYQYVQKLWNDGHEMAVHSVTHRGPELWWSQNATIEDWFDEMVGQANIMNRFASVRMEEIRGTRAPFLRVGWNRQFLMMKEFGFVYDASMVAPFSNPPIWPYTLDYKIPHTCTGSQQNCPSRSYPGIWEMVINQLEAGDFTCTMIDSCPPNLNGDDIYRMLTHNFKRHYLSNRAPLGLNFHATWFKRSDYLNAFLKFLDDLQKLPDVYFVTNQQAIQWMRQPKSNSDIHQFSAWGCKSKHLEKHEVVCTLSNTCKLRSRVLQQDRYFYTCKECPAQYPWIRNEFGLD